ncbi:MAG TPA: ComF family protein [Gammaproteobacteria bacterium]
MVYKWLRKAWAQVFPGNCMICGQVADTGMDLCFACRWHLPWLEYGCWRCANPLVPTTRDRLLCGRCIHKPPQFDRSYCAFIYQQPVNWLLQGLKYQRRLTGIPVLSRLLLEFLHPRLEFQPELIIPVPLHKSRLRMRGFNQALEIARPLARAFNIPLSTQICTRIRETAPQSELPASRRSANVRHAFRMQAPLTVKHVAIVDDIVTTGATVNELARMLKRHGAESVQVWAVARTPINSRIK